MASLEHPLPRDGRPVAAGTDLVAVVLLVTGGVTLVTGAWLFLSPGTFYDAIATYPPRNDHFLRDNGSFNVGLGLAALYGARRVSWRAPVLAILAVAFALHTISHLIDIGDTEPASLGVTNFVLLLVSTVVLAALFVRERGR